MCTIHAYPKERALNSYILSFDNISVKYTNKKFKYCIHLSGKHQIESKLSIKYLWATDTKIKKSKNLRNTKKHSFL